VLRRLALFLRFVLSLSTGTLGRADELAGGVEDPTWEIRILNLFDYFCACVTNPFLDLF
jgi:hypothetical protein